MHPQTEKSRRARQTLATLFTFTALLLLVTNIILGSELIRALPGIMANMNIGMPAYLAYLLMGAISLLELMVFSGVVDIEDGVDGAIEHIVLWSMRIVLPFDVLGNTFGVIIGNAPISEATERVAGNLTQFLVIFSRFPDATSFAEQVAIVGDGLFNLLITVAVLALAVLVGAGPEFFLGKYLKSQHPDFVREMREALRISRPGPVPGPVPGLVPGPQTARPVGGPQTARPVGGEQTARPVGGEQTARPVGGPQTARPVDGPQTVRPNRPPMPGGPPRRSNE